MIVFVGWLPSKTRCGTWCAGTPSASTSSRVLPNASASGWASRFAVSRSWWSPTTSFGLREADEVARDELRALVDQLVVGVLAVRARLAPHDRARSATRPGCPRGRRTSRCSPCPAAGSTPGGARGTGCTGGSRRSRRRRSCCTKCRSGPGASAGSARSARCGSARPSRGTRRACPGTRRGRSRPSARARSRSRTSSDRRPSPRTRTCWRCRSRTSRPPPRSWRPRRSAWPPRPSSPSFASDHSRAVRALVIVSSVVNVFDAMMNSVSSGSRSRVFDRSPCRRRSTRSGTSSSAR